VYTARDGPLPYISIEEFIQDFVKLWRDGVRIKVVATGWDNDENRVRTVDGTVTNIWYGSRTVEGGRPSLEELAGIATIELDRGDDAYTIGGWGAVFENMEVYELVVTNISFHEP